MEESVFERLADAELDRIEGLLEACGADVEVERMPGGVLEAEFADGSKIIVNRHLAAREIWVAARAGGFHFAPTGQGWIAARDGAELYARLSELVSAQSGMRVALVPEGD